MGRLVFAAVGDNCIDRFLPPIGKSLVGGNAVNVAVQLAKLGNEALYFGAVGNDEDGDRTRALLELNHVDVSHLKVRSAVTAYTNLRATPEGDREIVSEEFGACDDYAPDEADIARIRQMHHAHIGWINDGGKLRRRLVEAGVSVSQDISVNSAAVDREVEGLSVAFASAGHDESLGRGMLAEMLGQGAKCAVVTLGATGSLASDGVRQFRAGIKPVKVVDTTGAGDSFIAGFLSGFLRKMALPECLERGSVAAAIACSHVGGFPQEPDIL